MSTGPLLGELRPPSVRHRVALARIATAAAGLIFLALAVTRRLNFDESLALRAGWLDLAGEPSSPAFLMPWTLLAGAVGHLFADPGAVFVTLRIFAAGGVVAAFAFALRAAGLGAGGSAIAAWLALSNAAFATHGLEFRYDAAVLILLLLGYEAIVHERSPLLVGALAGTLALHHLKGAFFASALLLVATAMSANRRSTTITAAGGAIAAGLIWCGLLLPLGLLGRYAESLGTFFHLARESARAPLIETLGPALLRDLPWWLLVLTTLASTVFGGRPSEREPCELAALSLACAGVAFWLLHPHAWAYLAALPSALLAIQSARLLGSGAVSWRVPTVALAVGLLLQQLSMAAPPLDHLSRAFSAPMEPEAALLRGLRAELLPDDAILDPSGMAYFGRPCTREWYLDSLYAERLQRGEWMADLGSGLVPTCTLALNTYRMLALPPAALLQLRSNFVLMPSGILVPPERAADLSALPALARREIESFW
ncbi:MAG: hypothetical protein ABIU84_05825 [Thermoanaerobaculia bacterium]